MRAASWRSRPTPGNGTRTRTPGRTERCAGIRKSKVRRRGTGTAMRAMGVVVMATIYHSDPGGLPITAVGGVHNCLIGNLFVSYSQNLWISLWTGNNEVTTAIALRPVLVVCVKFKHD